MKLLNLSIAALALLSVTGCYWAHYHHHGEYPYYARASVAPARGYYVGYDSPSVSISHYDPWYAPPFYYYGYRSVNYYPDHYYVYPYSPVEPYRTYTPTRYNVGSDGRYYSRPRSISTRPSRIVPRKLR